MDVFLNELAEDQHQTDDWSKCQAPLNLLNECNTYGECDAEHKTTPPWPEQIKGHHVLCALCSLTDILK